MNLKILEKYITEQGIQFVENWLLDTPILIKLKSARKTKLGDYRFSRELKRHEITIDKSLAHDAFFFVLTHEIAHLIVRNHFQERVKAHGGEWKLVFGKMLRESIEVYNRDLKDVILHHSYNPKANLFSDKNLRMQLFLTEFDVEKMLDNLPKNQKFRLGNRVFEKGEKRKIRYICRETNTGKLYLVNGQVVVDEIMIG